MIKRTEIAKSISFSKSNIVEAHFSERDKRLAVIKNFINENFGEGKFYSKLKTYGTGSFSVNEVNY